MKTKGNYFLVFCLIFALTIISIQTTEGAPPQSNGPGYTLALSTDREVYLEGMTTKITVIATRLQNGEELTPELDNKLLYGTIDGSSLVFTRNGETGWKAEIVLQGSGEKVIAIELRKDYADAIADHLEVIAEFQAKIDELEAKLENETKEKKRENIQKQIDHFNELIEKHQQKIEEFQAPLATASKEITVHATPLISIISPQNGSFHSKDLTISVSSNSTLPGTAELLINNNTVQTNTGVTGDYTFDVTTTDYQGDGTYFISSKFKLPEFNFEISSQVVKVIFDNTPPVISNILPIGIVAEPRPVISGEFTDATSGIDTTAVAVSLDDDTLIVTPTAEGFTHNLTEDLKEGEHILSVTISDRAGNSATAQSTFTVVLKPEAPENLVAASGGCNVKLDWDDNTDANLAGYNVYRKNGTSDYTKLNTDKLIISEYKDAPVSPGVEYTYMVKAVNTFENESDPSNEVSATAGPVITVGADKDFPTITEAGNVAYAVQTGLQLSIMIDAGAYSESAILVNKPLIISTTSGSSDVLWQSDSDGVKLETTASGTSISNVLFYQMPGTAILGMGGEPAVTLTNITVNGCDTGIRDCAVTGDTLTVDNCRIGLKNVALDIDGLYMTGNQVAGEDIHCVINGGVIDGDLGGLGIDFDGDVTAIGVVFQNLNIPIMATGSVTLVDCVFINNTGPEVISNALTATNTWIEKNDDVNGGGTGPIYTPENNGGLYNIRLKDCVISNCSTVLSGFGQRDAGGEFIPGVGYIEIDNVEFLNCVTIAEESCNIIVRNSAVDGQIANCGNVQIYNTEFRTWPAVDNCVNVAVGIEVDVFNTLTDTEKGNYFTSFNSEGVVNSENVYLANIELESDFTNAPPFPQYRGIAGDCENVYGFEKFLTDTSGYTDIPSEYRRINVGSGWLARGTNNIELCNIKANMSVGIFTDCSTIVVDGGGFPDQEKISVAFSNIFMNCEDITCRNTEFYFNEYAGASPWVFGVFSYCTRVSCEDMRMFVEDPSYSYQVFSDVNFVTCNNVEIVNFSAPAYQSSNMEFVDCIINDSYALIYDFSNNFNLSCTNSRISSLYLENCTNVEIASCKVISLNADKKNNINIQDSYVGTLNAKDEFLGSLENVYIRNLDISGNTEPVSFNRAVIFGAVINNNSASVSFDKSTLSDIDFAGTKIHSVDTILTDIANLSVSPGSEISFCCVNSSDISGETDLTGCGFSLVTNIILASPLFITNPTGIPFPSSIGDNLTPNWNMPNFIPDAGSQCIGAGSIDSETGKNTTIGYFCPPKAELSASPQFSYNPGPVTISAADSYDADGSNTIVRYDWDTDNDGTIDISDGPSEVSINYITLGVFSVKVIVTDNEDLQDNETIQIGTNGDFVETDHEPPVIEVTAIDYDPVNGIYTGLSFQKNTKILTKNNSLQLSLSFKDATPIRIKTTSMGVLNPNDTLDLSLPAEGMHTVTVTAEDSNSNVSFLNILVCLDQTPPDTRIFYPLPEFVSNNSEPWVTEGYIDILGDAGANFIKLYTQNVDEYMKFEVAIKITNTQTGTISFFEKQLTLSEIDDNIFSIDISTEITGNVGDFVRYLIQPLANDPAGNGKEYSGNYLDSARGDGENVYLDLEFPTSNNTSDDLTGTYYVSNDVTSLESIPDVLWPEGPDGPTEVKVYFGTSEDTGMKQVIFNPPLDRETVNSSYSVYIGGVDSAGNYNPNLLEVPLFQCDSDSIDKQDPVDKWFIKYLLENHSDIYDLMFIISRVDINGEPYLVDVSGEAEIGYYFIDNGTIDGITNVNDIKEFLISQSCPNPAPIPDGSLLSFGVSNYNEIPDFGASPRPNYVGLSDLPNNFQIPVEEGNLINEQDSAFTGLPLARSIDFESGSYNDPSAIDPTVQFELQKAAQRIKLEMPDEYVPFCTVGGTHGTGGAPRAVAVPINVYNGTSKNVTFYLVNDDPVTYLSPPLVIIDKEAPIIGTPLTREQIGYLLIPNTTICENEIEYLDGSLESSQSIAGQFFITHGARYYNLHHSDTDQTYNSVNYIDFKNAVAETKVAISEAKKFTDGTGKEYVKIIIRVKNQEGNDVFLDETYLDPSKTSYKGKFERSRTLNNDGKREIQLPIIFYNRDIVEPSDAMNDNWPDEYKKAYTQMKFKGTLLVPVRSNEYVQFEKIKILKMNNGTELPGQTAGKPDVFARVALSVLAEGLAGTEDGEYRATQEIVVMLNDDNDNGTFTPNNKQTLDKDENPVNGENDLIPVRWSFQSTLLQPVLEKIKVEILNGQDCVSLWDDGIKSNLIASGTEFPINSQKTIYIEGKKRGVAQVQFSCILGGKSFKADLVVHVAKVNITRTNGRFFAFEPEVANQITDLIPIFIFPSQEPDEGEEEEAVVLRADAVALQPVPGTYSWNINGGNGIRIRNEAPTDPDNPPNQQIATLDHLQNHNDAGVPTYLTVEFLPRRMREHFSWDWRVIRENTPVNLGSAVQELYVFQEKRVSACAHPNITPYTVKLEDGSVETYNVDNNLFQHYINICRRFICIDNDGVNPANHTHSSGKGGDCDDVVAPVNFESNWQEGEDGVFTGDLAGNDFNIIQDVTILVDLITEHPEVRVKIVEMFSFEDAPVARAWRNRPSLVIPKSALHNYTAFLHEYGHNANLGHRPDSTDGLKISENIMNYVSEFNWGREFNREEGTLILQEESDL